MRPEKRVLANPSHAKKKLAARQQGTRHQSRNAPHGRKKMGNRRCDVLPEELRLQEVQQKRPGHSLP